MGTDALTSDISEFDCDDAAADGTGEVGDIGETSVTGVEGYTEGGDDDDDDDDDEEEEEEEEDALVLSQDNDEVNYESGGLDIPIPVKKKQKHRPMKAEEQIATIAALEEKLKEFPAPALNTGVGISVKQKLSKQPHLKIRVSASPSAEESAPKPAKKRKRASSLRDKTPRPPKRPAKRTLKLAAAEIKLSPLSPRVEALIGSLMQLDSSPRVRDVENIVSQAGEVLDNQPTGVLANEEIAVLLAQEEQWKDMAKRGDVSLKAIMNGFMERYGIIPFGALEEAESIAKIT